MFVDAAYRAVLKRSPEQAESLRDLKRLRSGPVNKIDLLADLRFSPEGRAKGVQLDGLLVPALIRRLGQLRLSVIRFVSAWRCYDSRIKCTLSESSPAMYSRRTRRLRILSISP